MKKELLHYVAAGNGPPVILIHGMAASLHDWEALLPELVPAGFRAYAPDLLGHGDSAKPDDPRLYHSRAVFACFEEWLESLGLTEPPVLIGHSLGGYLSLRYSLRHPEKLRALVLVDPLYSPNQLSPLLRVLQRRPGLGTKALQLVPEWMIHTVIGWDPTIATNFSHRARLQIASDLKRASPQILYIPRTVRDLTPKLPKVTQRTLVIWGEKDLTLRPASFPTLVAQLPAADGQVVPGCGHQPHIGKPELVNRAVLNFLKRL